MLKLTGKIVASSTLLLLFSSMICAEEPERWKGELISLSLHGVEFVAALETIAEEADIEIAVEAGGEEIGTVTVELKDVPWDKALDQLLRINNLAAEEIDGKWVVWRVGDPGLRLSSTQ